MTHRYRVAGLRSLLRTGPSPRIAVLGAGFGGIAAAVQVRRAGITSLTIFEAGDGVGGTWRQNTYPGAACDVRSHLYSFSFARNPAWSKAYADQPEILRYLEGVADDFDLRRHLLLRTRVVSARWDEDALTWELTTEAGSRHIVDVVISAVGTFGTPSFPDIPGLDTFTGPVVHTSRWPSGLDVTGQRVAVVGTGASALQLVPELAGTAAQVVVHQRSPAWVLPKADPPYTPEDQSRFRRNRVAALRHRHKIFRGQEQQTVVRLDDPRTEQRRLMALSYLHHKVADPELAAALTPSYPFGCKRVLLGGAYYAALQRPDVQLVTSPVTAVGPTSVTTADGAEREVDVVVLATGFHATRYLAGLEVVGRGGQRLHDVWGDEPRAFLGAAVPGFPNLFLLYGPGTNQGGQSLVFVLEAGARWARSAVTRLARRPGAIEVLPEAFEAYDAQLQEALEGTVWQSCGSYFRGPSGRILTQWPWTGLAYARRTRRVRGRDIVHTRRARAPR